MSRRQAFLKRQQKHLIKRSRNAMVERLRGNPFMPKTIIRNTSDGVKMSDVMWDFIEPYLDLAKTTSECKTLIQTAIVAWNVSLLPEEKRQQSLNDILQLLPKEQRESGKESILFLMVRKQMYFSRFKRFIFDFELLDKGDDGWHLSVLSTLPKEDHDDGKIIDSLWYKKKE